MLTSLSTGVSGMNANSTSLSVIGDNIANLNTVGFKGSTVAFGDILSSTLTGSSQIGHGVIVSSVAPLFSQGSFQTTANGLDLAIDGDGFFMVSGGGLKAFTRAGQFSLDKDGNIVNPDGFVLQGFTADATGTITGATGNLQVVLRQTPAQASSLVDIALNLDASAQQPADAFTLDGNNDGKNDDPANFNFSSTVTVYDSQGGGHDVTAYFVKTGDNAWTVHYVHNDPADATLLVEAGTQALSFDAEGALVDDSSSTQINFNFGTTVTSPQAVTFNYGTGTGETPPGTGLDGTTQFASSFSMLNLSQDGYSTGTLRSLNIAQDGTITGIFTNGQTRALGRVALARFNAPEGLVKLGKNLYAESFESGQPIVGGPDTSGLGRVLSSTLELSNVDLAEEFVKMIAAQRGFQANSRVITTTDELYQELVNLKR